MASAAEDSGDPVGADDVSLLHQRQEIEALIADKLPAERDSKQQRFSLCQGEVSVRSDHGLTVTNITMQPRIAIVWVDVRNSVNVVGGSNQISLSSLTGNRYSGWSNCE